ncbi:MAG: homocysteine S-methyltransferase family protein [Gammaproteobacteria bacterium]|nr:homocysteine S-methyltransferase family protein [Gammaproteobacteria bacterium]
MATWQDRLDRDEVLVIDGGTGTELERRGVPMGMAAWSGLAVHTHPAVVREVHEAYIDAGAEVIITNTFGTTRFLLETAGVGDEFEAINRGAVRLAMEARDASGRDVAIAGSISNLPPGMEAANYPPPDAELEGLRELAALLADSGVDLIALEMLQDTRHAARAMEAALATGLPVWLGVSCRHRPSGAGLVSFDIPNMDFAKPLDALIPMGPAVVNIMHSEIAAVPEAIAMVRERWSGALGVYPEIGDFEPPNWRKDQDVAPADFAAHARDWVGLGARLVGGCCGTTPEHIAALDAAFHAPSA